MNWRRAKKQRLAGHKERNASRRLLFQELEPRVLYSADAIGGADALLDEAKAVELVVDNVRHDEPANASHDTPPPIDLDALGSADARLPTRELVFVDTDTDGYEQLVEDLINNSDEGREFDVVILDNDRDGIEQISEVLATYESLDAVHIISHGDDGTIDLGNANVDLARLNDSAEAIAAWAGAFVDTGDLLIYGCNLAAGRDGEAFVDTLARLTDTDVAASDDLTGSLLLGGDWTLEYSAGAVETTVAVSQNLQENYDQVLATYTVTTTAASGAGSLEEAINLANASGTVDDVIEFNIGGGGAQTIVVSAGGLPAITDTVTIDATTQPGYAGEPLITLDGSATAGKNGFQFDANSDGSVVRGFKIIDFDSAGFLVKTGADNVTIAGNWIGTTGSGYTGPGVGGDGIDTRALNTTIGGLGSNDGNVITNVGDEGINIQGSGVTGHVIQGNIIGLDPDGSTTANAGDVGIAIISGTGNTIGGTAAGARNIISNNFEGIEINSNDNVVQGNYIGTDITGTLDRGNRSDDGVEIRNSATGNLIGGTAEGAGNLIAYNALSGIYLDSGDSNSIVGNTIAYNGQSGIFTDASASEIVGNVIYDNGTTGAFVELRITHNDAVVLHNTIHGSRSDGVEIGGSNTIVHNNIITGSAGYGINITGGSIAAESHNTITDAVTGPANLGGRANFALDASDLNADPLYRDLANGDFRLSSPASPAIDAGTDLGGAQPDVNGTSSGLYNGSAPNMGTFESWAPVGTPSNLRAVQAADGGIALNRDGANDAYFYAENGVSSALSAFTVELRFAAVASTNDTVLVSNTTAFGNLMSIEFIDATNALQINSVAGGSVNSTAVDYETALFDGAEHMLSVTWDNSSGAWQIFIDGVLIDSGSGFATGATISPGGDLLFGQQFDGSGNLDPSHGLSGTWYDVRVFDDVRSASEIVEHHRTGVPFDEANLVANWIFDNYGSGSVIADRVAGNDLLLGYGRGAGFTSGVASRRRTVA